VLADERHAEVRPVGAAELRGQRVAQEARAVGAPLRLGEQLLPRADRRAAVVEVGAGELAPVVEELRVLVLERPDLALDERVEVGEEPVRQQERPPPVAPAPPSRSRR
jgi:hypothetical protein